ncbi:patatin-like protein 2 [Dorcoceras hygrometricum]|uniref:Patatin-like protein 2 n=1 Tax=Dorcoceras hygrometricum TaxID=472368 RepID=A0A2Z7CQM5_9LAMI|nr:patatin-like protein 2 [Dorcoceras hygrometricum]
MFASTFALPLDGLSDLHEVPQDLVLEARRAFSYDDKLVSTSCKKMEFVFEFRLLNDILAKSVTLKAGSFDAVTHERFLMMTAIYGGVPVNWSKIQFKVLKDMVTPGSKQARGFAVQICIVLKGYPDLELGGSKEFRPLKILTAKTVGKYIAINKNIAVEDVEDEPVMEKQAEKKKAMYKKRPAPTVESPVVKRKRTSRRTTPAATYLTLVTVAQEAVPIQMISAVTHPAPKRKAPKRRLQLPAGSDDEIVEK